MQARRQHTQRDMDAWTEPREPLADATLQKLGGDRREAMKAADPCVLRQWNEGLLAAAESGNAAATRVFMQGGGDPFWTQKSAAPDAPLAFEVAWRAADTGTAEEICRFGPFPQALANSALLERAAAIAPFVAQEMVRWGALPTPRALLNAVSAGAHSLADDMIAAGANAPAAAQLAREEARAKGAALGAAIEQSLARWEAKELAQAAPASSRPRARRAGL